MHINMDTAPMSISAIVRKKRDGRALTRTEIREIIDGYVAGSVPDYQVSALLMAIFFRGLDERETWELTSAMTDSGGTVDLSTLEGVTVDKHSTGGVGDKTTLVLGPLLAAAGLKVAKMSGRGLGHTGGTVDKLESIPGLSTMLTPDAMLAQVARIVIAVVAQPAMLVPADGLLYAMRDVTATVDSLPLIASSIMSKKLAAGARAMVLDVKTGSGAFMASPDEAFALAHALVRIGSEAGRGVRAVVTSMDQPLGLTVGNALEVREAVETLRGGGPPDLRELCLVLATELLHLTGSAGTMEQARGTLERLLDRGNALDCFRLLVEAQGGDSRVADDPEGVLPSARLSAALETPEAGVVAAIEALAVGEAARALGAGRKRKDEAIDPAAGVRLHHKVCDKVRRSEPWATVYAADQAHLDAGSTLMRSALRLSDSSAEPPALIRGRVESL